MTRSFLIFGLFGVYFWLYKPMTPFQQYLENNFRRMQNLIISSKHKNDCKFAFDVVTDVHILRGGEGEYRVP